MLSRMRAPEFVRVPLGSLRDPALRRIDAAFVGFTVAEWATWIAMLVYAFDQGGVVATGLVAVIQLIPAAVFAPFGASLAERFPRGRVLVAGYGAQALAMALTAAVLLADAPSWLVYLLAAIAATSVTLTRPAQSALLPALAPTPEALTAANAALAMIENLGILAAPAIAAALLALSGPGLVYAASAVLLAVAGAIVAGVGAPDQDPGTADPAPDADLRHALRVLAEDRGALLLVVLLAGQAIQIGALDVLFVVLALDVLEIGEAGVGILNSAFGLGGVAGALAAGALGASGPLPRWVVIGTMLWGGGLALVALLPGAMVVFALVAIAGLGRSLLDVAGRTLLQRGTRPDVLSRVFGVLEGLTMAALAAGALLVPLLVETLGIQAALVIVGSLLPALVVLTLRALLRADAGRPAPLAQLALLRRTAIFAPLPRPTLEGVAAALESHDAPAGSVLIREGEPGDRVYVIERGEVAVSIAGREVRQLGPGQWFGEIALLRDVPRTATVTARSAVRLYALGREAFLDAMRSRAGGVRGAEAIAQWRDG